MAPKEVGIELRLGKLEPDWRLTGSTELLGYHQVLLCTKPELTLTDGGPARCRS
jgi:hypothetical protein